MKEKKNLLNGSATFSRLFHYSPAQCDVSIGSSINATEWTIVGRGLINSSTLPIGSMRRPSVIDNHRFFDRDWWVGGRKRGCHLFLIFFGFLRHSSLPLFCLVGFLNMDSRYRCAWISDWKVIQNRWEPPRISIDHRSVNDRESLLKIWLAVMALIIDCFRPIDYCVDSLGNHIYHSRNYRSTKTWESIMTRRRSPSVGDFF